MIDVPNVDDAPWANPYAVPLRLDPHFGQEGYARTPVGTTSQIDTLLLRPDASIIAVGTTHPFSPDLAFISYLANGTLDRAFGEQGTVRSSITLEPDELKDAVLLPDGSLLVSGMATIGYYGFIAKYGPDGKADDSFGNHSVFGNHGVVYGPMSVSSFNALAVMPDGAIIAAGNRDSRGWSYPWASSSSEGLLPELFLRRYDGDGRLDAEFRTDLAATTLTTAYDIELLGDGGILLAGSSDGHLALSRHAANGTPDVSFGDGGTVILPSGDWSRAYEVALLPDGKIIAFGRRAIGSDTDALVARFLPDGTPDIGFGTLGAVTIDLPDAVAWQPAIVVMDDGSLLTTASFRHSSGTSTALLRIDAAGNVYEPWGSPGADTLILDNLSAATIAVQDDGSILLGGSSPTEEPGRTQFAVARLLFDATPLLEATASTLFEAAAPANLFIDPEGQPLTYRAERVDGLPLPRWLAFDPDTLTFLGTPSEEAAGTLRLAVYASDGTSETRSDLALTIKPQHGTLGSDSGGRLEGTAGADTLAGGTSTDEIFGGAGDDILKGGGGADRLDGEAGRDTAVYDGRSDQYVFFEHLGALYVVDRVANRDATDLLDGIEHLRFLADGWDIALAARHVPSILEYIASYHDLLEGFGTDEALAYQHLLGSGLQELRTPTFDGLAYIASYADLMAGLGADAQAGAMHYVRAGSAEGRDITFDSLAYIAANPDLVVSLGANADLGAAHFILHGHAEGRPSTFDAAQYLANYADLRTGFGSSSQLATAHYIEAGFHEGRTDQPLI